MAASVSTIVKKTNILITGTHHLMLLGQDVVPSFTVRTGSYRAQRYMPSLRAFDLNQTP